MSPWIGLLLRRALQIVVLTLLVSTLCFFMARSLPGDIAMRIAAGRYGYDLVNLAASDAVRTELGLDRSVWLALVDWWSGIAQFDLGTSLISGEPIGAEVAHHLGASLKLACAAALIAAAIGLPLGIYSGLHPDSWLDRLVLALTIALRSTPPFLLAVVLMLMFAVHWGALPVGGDEQFASLILPALTLGLGLAAGLARVTHIALRQACALPSFEFARTKGLSDWQAVTRHALRHAALPVLAYLGLHVVLFIEGAVVVETLFAWPGIGHALVHAIFGRDIPLIQGAALSIGLIVVVLNLLIDAACFALDPRRRAAG